MVSHYRLKIINIYSFYNTISSRLEIKNLLKVLSKSSIRTEYRPRIQIPKMNRPIIMRNFNLYYPLFDEMDTISNITPFNDYSLSIILRLPKAVHNILHYVLVKKTEIRHV